MKARKLLYSAILAAGMMGGFGSCVGDLDVVPLDPNVNTSDRAYQTVQDYENALAKVYALWAMSGQDGAGSSDISLGDAGNTTLIRSWFILQTHPTDELKNANNDAWVPNLNYMNWGTAEIEPIEAVYQRCMYIVALANDFLKNLPNAPEGIDQNSFRAQARFCRALAYYTLMDTFGNPPFITEDNYSIAPKQIGRDGIFNYVERELLDIINSGVLPERGTGDDYGHASQGAAWGLLARMYLNAEVYTGTQRYADCMNACQEVIILGYGLASDYQALFCGDNGENADALQEIIYPVMLEGVDVNGDLMTTESYANLISASRPNTVSEEIEAVAGDAKFQFCLSHWGTREGWAGYRGTSDLVRVFEYADNNNPKADEILDKRGIFRDRNYDDEELTIRIGNTVTGTFYTNGWWVYKWTNLDHNGQPLVDLSLASTVAFVNTDFPLLRLGDIYLMYAEAAARTGQNLSTAVSYVNALRARGYQGQGNYTINESWLTGSAQVGYEGPNVQYGNILNERMRELYWEGQRRTDLIRFGLLTGNSYLWEWKNGAENGSAVNERYNLYPIPVSDMQANGGLTQNSGY